MSPHPDFIEFHPPTPPTPGSRPTLVLYGSITPSNWQSRLSASLSHLPIAILNPLRPDWDSSWVESITFPPFKEQVEWEMDAAGAANVIAFYFDPGKESPITLLELGLYAGTGKAVVCCPEGFYKRGNVEIVCKRYGVVLVETLEELVGEVGRRLEGVIEKEKEG